MTTTILTFPATSSPRAPTTRILISLLPGPEGQIFPANFLTIAQSVNRCSLSDTFGASFNDIGTPAGVFVVALAGGVIGALCDDVERTAVGFGIAVGSEFAR